MLKRSIFREIRDSLGRYLAIIAIIALGVGFFAGLRVTKTDMIETAQRYIDEHSLYDYRLLSTLGFDDEAVARLSAAPGISAGEGSFSADFLMDTQTGSSVVLRAHSLTERVNTAALVTGRLPENDRECVVDALNFPADVVGTELTLSQENTEAVRKLFRHASYTVVGTVNAVTYLNYERGSTALGNGSLYGFVLIPYEGFDTDYYTEICLSLRESGPIYSDAYEAAAEAGTDEITKLAQVQADRRRAELLDSAETELQEARDQLDEGWAEYTEQRDNAMEELSGAALQLEDGAREIRENEEKLAQGEAEIALAAGELAQGRRAWQEGRNAYEEERRRAEEQLAAAEQELEENRRQLILGLKTLGEADLDGAEAQLRQARERYDLLSRLYKTAAIALAAGRVTAAELRELAAEAGTVGYDLPREAEEITAGDLANVHSLISAKFREAEAELDSAEYELWQGREQEAMLQRAKLQLEQGEQELKAAREEAQCRFREAEEELDAAARELEQGEARLLRARRELEDGRQQLTDGRAELEKGRKEYEDARQTAYEKLAEGRRELLEGEQEYRGAREKLAELDEAQVYVLDRTTNVGYMCFESDSNIVEAISRVFPAFFFFVAALVCITTMTRMVDEQRTQIGVLKALGYTGFAIMMKYMVYSGSASLIGCVVGFVAGSIVFPRVLWAVYQIMYNFSGLTLVFDLRLAAVLITAFMACALGATWFACRSELAVVPSELMRPKAPKSGKRVFLEHVPFIWNRMQFLHKVSFRNIFRYKKRLIMMILGISGCTALLITGFGIRDSIKNVGNYQFEDISLYDYAVTFREPADENTRQRILKAGEGSVSDVLLMHESTLDLVTEEQTKPVNFVVCREDISPFLDMHGEDGPVAYPGPGEIAICDALADRLHIAPGDNITLRTSDMRELHVTVSGVFKNYVYYYVFVSDETCLDQWGYVPDCRTAYVNTTDGADVHASAARIMELEETAAVMVVQDLRERVDNMMESLDYIVLLVVFCAAMLALIVLYNLTNINITERIREIATIKVLGFTSAETASYVFRENVLLTAMGSLFGIFLGRLLHAYVMQQIRIDMISFDVRVEPLSLLLSIGITFAFTIGINFLMRFRLDRINMAESLKSIE